MDIQTLSKKFEAVCDNVEQVIQGKRPEIERTITCLLSEGHILIEDVPGVGKTTLARSLARSINCECNRIQFTPDLLPADITGMNVYNRKKEEFEFNPGPIFTNILLADEINRTTARTQSALLEAMNEEQVTVDGTAHPLADPFMVIATQNPLEFSGTYPLPESQLDRFLFRIDMGYPDREHEKMMLRQRTNSDPIESLDPVLTAEEVVEARETVRAVNVEDQIREYILRIIRATREDPDFRAGVSPRGGLFLQRAAQARAALNGRDYVIPDDVKELVLPTFTHRVIRPSGTGDEKRFGTREKIKKILSGVEVPV